jgi:hypothetical protein
MEQEQKDSLDMFERSYKYVITDTNTISSTRPGLITAMGKLKTDFIDKIKLADQNQGAGITGFATDKRAKRIVLNEILHGVTSGTYAFASATNDLVLQGQMKLTLTDIRNISDESIVDKVNYIMGIVNPILLVPGSTLPDYGVNTLLVNTDLKNARDAYDAAEEEPQDQIAIRESYTQALEPLFEGGKALLLDVADKVANTLKSTQRTWWNGYRNARKIVSTGHRFNTVEGDVLVEGTNAKVYNALLTLTHESGKVYTGKSDVDGHFKMISLLQGTYSSFVVTGDGFQLENLGPFKLVRGHVVSKTIFMDPV